MEDDTERGYMEDLKKDFGIDLTRPSKTVAAAPKADPVKKDKEEPDKSSSLTSWSEDKALLEAALTSEERKKFLLDRHEKLTIENENLKRELEEIKLRIQSFRTSERQQEASDE